MNTNAGKAYERRPEVSNPRAVEAWALIESSKDLSAAKENPGNLDMLRNSLRSNMILWTVFQDAVLDSSSPLPFEIRNNLLNLSRFIDKHTLQCLSDEDGLGLDILIDINRNIAAGLMENNAGVDANNDQQTQGSEPINAEPDEAPKEAPVSSIGNIEA